MQFGQRRFVSAMEDKLKKTLASAEAYDTVAPWRESGYKSLRGDKVKVLPTAQ